MGDDQAADAERWADLADQLSRWPDLVTRLLIEHHDDGSGRCAGCSIQRPVVYPCALAKLAREAQRLRG